MSTSKRGKTFEDEFACSLKELSIPVWYHNFNNVGHFLGPKRPADFLVMALARGWLIELKEIHGNTIPFSSVKPHQEEHHEVVAPTGCRALVIVKQVLPRGSKAFAWEWTLWKHIRDFNVRKSILIPPLSMPEDACQVDRYTNDSGQTRWNLQKMFERLV